MGDTVSVMDSFVRRETAVDAVDARGAVPVRGPVFEILADPAMIRIAWLAAGIAALLVAVAAVL